jgi:hypothetical protein
MESRLFSRFDVNREENKQFKDDLILFLGLARQVRDIVLTNSAQLRLLVLESEGEELIRKTEETTQQPATIAARLLNMGGFFLEQLWDSEIRKEDTPEKWANDLSSLQVLTTDYQREAFLGSARFLLDEVFPGYEGRKKEIAFAAGVLPSFKSIGTTVELRAVIAPKFRFGMKPDEYAPQVASVVPIVSISIGVDVGMPERFHFQASERELKLLLAQLEAAKRDLEELKKRFSVR